MCKYCKMDGLRQENPRKTKTYRNYHYNIKERSSEYIISRFVRSFIKNRNLYFNKKGEINERF